MSIERRKGGSEGRRKSDTYMLKHVLALLVTILYREKADGIQLPPFRAMTQSAR